MSTALYGVEVALAIALIVIFLLQAKGGGLSGIFGGGFAGSTFRTRRGIEKIVFRLGIILTVIFVICCALSVKLY
jgi:preprotein translocase subunit SecG